MIDSMIEPWQLPFMQHAFLAVIVIGLTSGAIGTFVVLRGVGFLGDALSHAIFPGLAIAFITGGNIMVGALVAAVVVSLGIGAVSQNERVNNDTAIGVLFVGAFALGIALMTSQASFQRDLTSFLFGSVLGVSRDDLRTIALVSAGVIRRARIRMLPTICKPVTIVSASRIRKSWS